MVHVMFATCIYFYLQSLPRSVENVVLYSDACTRQNRKQITVSVLMYAVNKIINIKQTDKKFFESSHTAIACMLRSSFLRRKLYVPRQWDTVITMARRGNPCTVVPKKHGDFHDFKNLKSKIKKH